MENADLNKPIKRNLKTNEAYLYEISQILLTKYKCFPVQFWDEKGQELDEKTVMIIDSSNKSISISRRNDVWKVSRNGTNFSFSFVLKEDDSTFSYRNKELGVEYSFSERIISDEILERTIIKHAGGLKTRFKCYIRDDMIFIKEFIQNKNGNEHTIAICNTDLAQMESDIEIAGYILKIIDEHLEEIDDDVNEEEIIEESYPEIDEEKSEELYRRDIESEYGEVYYDNKRNMIHIVRYDFPKDVHDFDPEKYQEFVEGLQKCDLNKSQNVVIQTDEIDDDEFGLYDDASYRVFYKEEIEDEELKRQIIDLVYTAVSEENSEVMDLYGELGSIQDEYNEAVNMIRSYYASLDIDNLEDHSDR